MKYRFNAAIFVRGGRAFIEIPFNVWEEAGGQTRNFGEQTVCGRARRASGAGSRPQGRRPGRAESSCDMPPWYRWCRVEAGGLTRNFEKKQVRDRAVK